jgi:hypothetical protein
MFPLGDGVRIETMTHIRLTATVILSTFALACVTPVPESYPPQANEPPERQLDVDYMPRIAPFKIEDDRYYYTRVNLWYEYQQHDTTNYIRGTLIPVNTKVRLRATRRIAETRRSRANLLALTVHVVDENTSIQISNRKGHSGVSLKEIVFRTFSPQPIDLSVFDPPTRAAIAAGTPMTGMTKYQVLLARGYPPGHRTRSLTADTWYYWNSRFSYHSVAFSDGRLLEGAVDNSDSRRLRPNGL